jgi:hypothetical protein
LRDIVFVYLGGKVPKYVDASLALAKKYSGLDVTFIAQDSLSSRFGELNINFVSLENFYDPLTFENAKKNVTLDHQFRSGFWLKTLERLFVLKQFMIYESRDSIFHAELDQVFFGADELLDNLITTGLRGIFYPLHNTEKAVASVFYSNDIDALDSILELSCNGPSFANEMELLITWSKKFPNKFIALPTLKDILLEREKVTNKNKFKTVDHKSLGGIVDASELGLWVAGRDPKNLALSEKPATKFTYPSSSASLSTNSLKNLRFELSSMGDELTITYPDNSIHIRVFNLHIQAKIHGWLIKNQSHLFLMFLKANSPDKFRFPGTRRIQIQYAVIVILSRIRKEKISYIYSKLIEVTKCIINHLK